MTERVISDAAVRRRSAWIDEIVTLSGEFGADSTRVDAELRNEIRIEGSVAILDHLRLCGAIPERYGHDSSEEKLYSKYTDSLLASVFRHIGLQAVVLSERADTADVEAVGNGLSLVADAKVFRLSRTAKNQKDFKIEALHGWKHGKPQAMVVCPIYQLPSSTSQIYQQAISRNVCVFTYSHLAVLVMLSDVAGASVAQTLLKRVFHSAETLNPTKDAAMYWQALNTTMLKSHPRVRKLWLQEKQATSESIAYAKEEALTFLSREREEIMCMSRDEAIESLIKGRNIDGRTRIVNAVYDRGILDMLKQQ